MSTIDIDDDFQIDPKTERRMNQHARTLTTTANIDDRERIKRDTEAFLKSGGKIMQVPTGKSSVEPEPVNQPASEVKLRATANSNSSRRTNAAVKKCRLTDTHKRIIQTIRDIEQRGETATLARISKYGGFERCNLATNLDTVIVRGYAEKNGPIYTATAKEF